MPCVAQRAWAAGFVLGGALAITAAAVAVGKVDTRGASLGLHSGRDDSLEQYEEFGRWLGRDVLYRVVFCDPSKWDGIARPWFLGTTEKWLGSRPDRVEVISVPLLPTHSRGQFAAVAAGEHDEPFATLARTLVRKGMVDRVIVRLAWEGNGDWYPWSYLRDPAGFRAAFRRAVQAMRAIAPGLRIEWCVSCRAPRRGGAHWTEGYPGDDVVDIISLDVYDQWSSSWTQLMDGDCGLREIRAFATEHGKPEAYPEWGCSTDSSSQGGGDNPAFVTAMAAWFAGRPGSVLYQAYWNTSSDGPNAAIHGPSSGSVPKAAAVYRRLFGMPGPEAEGVSMRSASVAVGEHQIHGSASPRSLMPGGSGVDRHLSTLVGD